MKQHVITVLSLLAVGALCTLIFAMSAQPAVESADTSAGVSEVLARFFVPSFDALPEAQRLHWLELMDRPVRKTAHFLEYALLGVLAFNAVIQLARERVLPVRGLGWQALAGWLFAACCGVLDEIHQGFVAGRACMPGDMLLDATGALCGVLLLALVLKALRSRVHAL